MPEITYEVKTEYADEPDCNTHEYFTEVPAAYAYLAPILEANEFYRLSFVVDTTRVTIKAIYP